MKKDLFIFGAISLAVISAVISSVGFGEYDDSSGTTDTLSGSYSCDSSNSSSSYSGSSSKEIEHYCEADGCYKEGSKEIVSLSGEKEYYCHDHYQEIRDFISMMEEDVGAGTASKHKCEECSKEGTQEIVGLSGETEYYCYDHYQEIQDFISMMEEDVSAGTASKHKCEECSKEGTQEIVGLSGETEYYCTEHFNEIVEIVSMLYGYE